MQSNDVFSLLAHFPSLPESWILIGGPALVGIGSASILILVRYFKQKKERSEFKTELDILTHAPSEVQTVEVKQAAQPAVELELTWAEKMTRSLTRSREFLSLQIAGLFGAGAKLDESLLEKIHETLYRADFGVATTEKMIGQIKLALRGYETVTYEDIRPIVKTEIKKIFSAAHLQEEVTTSGPKVLLVVGVNGVGKTTSIAKMARVFLDDGKKVLLAAADTFRAAAIEQLCEWGNRLEIEVVKHQAGADPAAVAFDAVKAAKARGIDILIIDTAGRLHNKIELMDELGKITKVISREIPGAPHETLLVIDATTGQNAVLQAKAFMGVTKLTGLIVTKLDGTAKGGVIVNVVEQLKIPVKFLGVGEKVSDMKNFEAEVFAESLI